MEHPESLTCCSRCGCHDAVSIEQAIFQGKLLWHESTHCHSCGLQMEADGDGFPSAGIKELLLLRYGTWDVRQDEIASVHLVHKIFREHLGLSSQESLERIKSVPGAIFRGTKTEALWLQQLLANVGETATASPASASSA